MCVVCAACSLHVVYVVSICMTCYVYVLCRVVWLYLCMGGSMDVTGMCMIMTYVVYVVACCMCV